MDGAAQAGGVVFEVGGVVHGILVCAGDFGEVV